MSLARVKVWNPGDVLTAADLNAEFNNILNNPTTLISPFTANLDFANFQAVRMRVENVTTTQAAGQIGRLMFNTSGNMLEVDNGSEIMKVAALVGSSMATGSYPTVTSTGGSGAPIWGQGRMLWALFSGVVACSQISPQSQVGFLSSANSIIRNSSGSYSLVYANQLSFATAFFSCNGASTGGLAIPLIAGLSTTAVTVNVLNTAASLVDVSAMSVAVIGLP
jgi:hypothetical protein